MRCAFTAGSQVSIQSSLYCFEILFTAWFCCFTLFFLRSSLLNIAKNSAMLVFKVSYRIVKGVCTHKENTTTCQSSEASVQLNGHLLVPIENPPHVSTDPFNVVSSSKDKTRTKHNKERTQMYPQLMQLAFNLQNPSILKVHANIPSYLECRDTEEGQQKQERTSNKPNQARATRK